MHFHGPLEHDAALYDALHTGSRVEAVLQQDMLLVLETDAICPSNEWGVAKRVH